MSKFRVDQRVWAPVYRLPDGDGAPYAIAKGIVRSMDKRSCDVDLGALGQHRIASSMLHESVGVCIVRIGDFQSEHLVLDPICKSVLNFLKVVLPDDCVKQIGLRTLAEFEEFFEKFASAYPLWIVVGHGTAAGGLCFTNKATCASVDLAQKLLPHAASPRTFLFLSCHTGSSAFAKRFSSSHELCDVLIAPVGALHGAVASQFAQTFLIYRYLEGRGVSVAFKKAIENTPMSTRFRLWRRGQMKRAGATA